MNKGKSSKTQYINTSSELTRDFQNSTQKRKLENSVPESGTKQQRMSIKDKTPQKKRRN